jgi:hypothetical protein
MCPLLSMAGFAEAAWAEALGLLCFGLVIVTASVFVALVLRSRILAMITLGLDSMLSMLFEPWHAFRPVESNDSDFTSVMGFLRDLACWWVAVSTATLVSVVWACCDRSKPRVRLFQTHSRSRIAWLVALCLTILLIVVISQ